MDVHLDAVLIRRANHEDEGGHIAQRRERREGAPLAARGFHGRRVHVLHLGGGELLGLVHLPEPLQPRVGHGDRPEVDPLATSRPRDRLPPRQGGEEGGLAALGGAEDPELQAPGFVPPAAASFAASVSACSLAQGASSSSGKRVT